MGICFASSSSYVWGEFTRKYFVPYNLNRVLISGLNNFNVNQIDIRAWLKINFHLINSMSCIFDISLYHYEISSTTMISFESWNIFRFQTIYYGLLMFISTKRNFSSCTFVDFWTVMLVLFLFFLLCYWTDFQKRWNLTMNNFRFTSRHNFTNQNITLTFTNLI